MLIALDNSSMSTDEAQMDDNQEKEKRRRDQTGRSSHVFEANWSNTKAANRVRQVWRDERIESNNILVVCVVLALQMGEENTCALNQLELSKLARVAKSSLNRLLLTAEQLGYFERAPGLGRSPTIYTATGDWMI